MTIKIAGSGGSIRFSGTGGRLYMPLLGGGGGGGGGSGVSRTFRYYRWDFTDTKWDGVTGGGINAGVQLAELEIMSGGSRVDYTGASLILPDIGSRTSDASMARWIDGSFNTDVGAPPGRLAENGDLSFDYVARFTIDFGAGKKTADAFRFATSPVGQPIERDPIRWILRGSDDNSTWTTLHDQTASDASITADRSAWTQVFLFT